MECVKPITITHRTRYVKNSRGPIVEYRGGKLKVPCGKCAFCLVNKRKAWMFRIHHEMRTQMHRGYFLTLTYDERHVERLPNGLLSLRFRDVQLYLKRIRKAKYYAKYICVGEYGQKPITGTAPRPHYHLLIWTDCPPEKLEKEWFYGGVRFGTLTMASAMYTLKYIIQPKQNQDKETGMEKTRAQFSKGLGINYLDKQTYDFHTQIEDDPNFHSYIDGEKVGLPKYYRDKIFTRYQKNLMSDQLWKEKFWNERKLYHETVALGVKRPRLYLLNIRLDECRMILKKTKFNLSL